jgi:hypothetical protein
MMIEISRWRRGKKGSRCFEDEKQVACRLVRGTKARQLLVRVRKEAMCEVISEVCNVLCSFLMIQIGKDMNQVLKTAFSYGPIN